MTPEFGFDPGNDPEDYIPWDEGNQLPDQLEEEDD